MSDAKVFQLEGGTVVELPSRSIEMERTLQRLLEADLDTFLKVRFLASEHTTGNAHRGRIDTLGLDENNCPVIIEYKRSLNENVVTQGLFYLDWLLDHRGDFKLMVLERLGKDAADQIDWSAPRLLCIANDFTKYDRHAIQQINRNIELIRYRKYGDSLLLLELTNVTTADPINYTSEGDEVNTKAQTYKTISYHITQASTDLRERFEAMTTYLMSLGDDVQIKELKTYMAFKRLTNFVCADIRPTSNEIVLYLRVDPETVPLEPEFTKDVKAIGHFGTGDLEVRLKSAADLEKAKPLIMKSYESS